MGEQDGCARLFELVKALTELPGPVGQEEPVQAWLADRWGRIANEVRRTRVGNVLACLGGRGPRLVLVGHADEICLMVKSVSQEGLLHVWPYYNDTLGQPPRWFVPINQASLVVTDAGTVEGVIATASGHVVGGRKREKVRFDWNDLFVDVGVRSRTELESAHPPTTARHRWQGYG